MESALYCSEFPREIATTDLLDIAVSSSREYLRGILKQYNTNDTAQGLHKNGKSTKSWMYCDELHESLDSVGMRSCIVVPLLGDSSHLATGS